MTDNVKNRRAQDRARISLAEEHGVHFWTQVLGVSKTHLSSIIARVGDSADAVRRELNK